MKSSIFIKTYSVDLRWLEWSLRFLKKNWKTQSEIVICAPPDCSTTLRAMQDLVGQEIRIAEMEQWENGYTHQQYMKMNAEAYCSGDYITFIDSDAMLMLPTSLEEDLLVDGKPLIWYTEYTRIHAPWDGLVSQVMALRPKYEYMRCFPITYHRSTLPACRAHIEAIQGTTLYDFMSRARSWSEFNIMGFYAYIFERKRYEWRNTYEHEENQGHFRHDRVRQFHNVLDWNPGTLPFLENLYGEPVPSSVFNEGKVIATPIGGQQALIDKIRTHVLPKSTVIDVGAHVGLHAVAYAEAGAQVYAFEPNPESFTTLWRALYHTSGGSAFAFAVSDKPGVLNMQMDKSCSEASYIAPEGDPVPVITLDEFFEQNQDFMGNVSVLKVDVEGYELNVLRGAKKLIAKHNPVIVFECQKDTLSRNGFSKEDLFKLLAELDYDYEISTTDPRANTDEDTYFFDVFAFPRALARTDSLRSVGDQEREPPEQMGAGNGETGSRFVADSPDHQVHYSQLGSD